MIFFCIVLIWTEFSRVHWETVEYFILFENEKLFAIVEIHATIGNTTVVVKLPTHKPVLDTFPVISGIGANVYFILCFGVVVSKHLQDCVMKYSYFSIVRDQIDFLKFHGQIGYIFSDFILG